jgi:hypothetical protein
VDEVFGTHSIGGELALVVAGRRAVRAAVAAAVEGDHPAMPGQAGICIFQYREWMIDHAGRRKMVGSPEP